MSFVFSVQEDMVGKQSMDPNARTDHGWTLLQIAAHLGHLNTADVLLRYKADPNKSDKHGRTALHVCTTGEVTNLLLRFGANICAKDVSGRTPLVCACKHGVAHVAAALLKEKGSDGRGGCTQEDVRNAFSIAVSKSGREELVSLLRANMTWDDNMVDMDENSAKDTDSGSDSGNDLGCPGSTTT
jgi:ankyrin repeat protein